MRGRSAPLFGMGRSQPEGLVILVRFQLWARRTLATYVVACVRAICCTTPDERLLPQSYSILMMNFYHRRRRLHASGEHESRDGSPLDWKVDTAIVRIWIHTFHGRRLLRGSKSSQAVSRTTIKWLRNRLDFFSNAIFTM